MVGSLLATGGGCCFAGAPTGELLALEARDGRLLWRYQTGSGIHGSPMAYSVNGTEYVALASG
jgi:alcohol dehydrogenase (cytochrome c)